MRSFRIRKILPDGSIKIEYQGTLREITDDFISIDTGWSREPLYLGYVLFEPDDKWIETFFFKRWYNIFRIASGKGELKGFYINITKPPVIGQDTIDWEDLAIDLWVRPDGSYLVLDEDEFEELDLALEIKEKAIKTLEEVKTMIERSQGPLAEIRS